ncbi:hypothetical protein EVC45_02090 [Paraburkholderia sp. UYCP14C]|nr:hypothetical protein EVC45_02090 [Paraburkholderia sp. UYCP14C]
MPEWRSGRRTQPTTMKIKILGSGAGGGLPQWNKGTRAFYAPGLAQMRDEIHAEMCGADLVLVDGTFWTATEMIELGISTKHADDMGHLAQCGESGRRGMIDWLDTLPRVTRKVHTHINNTNPILDLNSAEHAQLRARGIAVAHDGMMFLL